MRARRRSLAAMGTMVIVLQTAALAADAVPVVATIDEMAAQVLTISGAETNDGFATGVTSERDPLRTAFAMFPATMFDKKHWDGIMDFGSVK